MSGMMMLRLALQKEIDVLDVNQLKDDLKLTEEILKDGIRIYRAL